MPLDLRHPGVDPPLVDGEEEVLLRGEVRVDRALGEAGLRRHRVERGGVEPLGGEEALRCVYQLVAGV
jgi:hypothetical protein